MDAIEAVHTELVSCARIPLAFYRQFYSGPAGGFGIWCYRVNREIQRRYGVKLRKRKDAYEPLNPVQQVHSGDTHGLKALRQKEYQIEAYDGVMIRPDAPEELKGKALAKREKAASSLVDMTSRQRLRARVAALLDQK